MAKYDLVSSKEAGNYINTEQYKRDCATRLGIRRQWHMDHKPYTVSEEVEKDGESGSNTDVG